MTRIWILEEFIRIRIQLELTRIRVDFTRIRIHPSRRKKLDLDRTVKKQPGSDITIYKSPFKGDMITKK